MKNISIYTKQISYGRYKVEVVKDFNTLGTFETTEMQLIDDIKTMKNGDFEHQLVMCDTFNEVKETCLNKL